MKFERLQQRINSSEGKMEWVFGMFGMLFIMVIALFEFQYSIYRSASSYIEDALAASGLAALLIDLEKYGTDHSVEISDPVNAYDVYVDTLKNNLGLNDEFVPGNEVLFFDPVSIETFVVFNVSEEGVTQITLKDFRIIAIEHKNLGEATAPNGQQIRSTGIYSELAYKTKGIFGIEIEGKKGKLVEVNRNEREEENEE